MSAPPRHLTAIALDAFIALALFGCIPVAVKYVHANAYTIGIVRLGVATAFVLLIAAFRREIKPLPKGDLVWLFVIGALFFAHWLTYFISIKISSASIGAIGLSTYGVDLLILGALAGHGRIRAVDVVAVIFAVGGAIVVVPGIAGGRGAIAGMVLALLSAFFYATLPILHQRVAHMTTSIRTLGQFGVALLLFLMFLPKSNWDLSRGDWGALLFLAIGATLIAHTLWVRVTTALSPAAASVVYYGNVPFAVLLGVVVLGEPLTWRTVTGASLIITGGLVGLLPQLQQRRTAAPVPDID